LRAERNDDKSESALLFVPDDARDLLQNKIAAYGEQGPTDAGQFEMLAGFAPISGRDLFVGDVDFESRELAWWELWVAAGNDRADRIAVLAREAGLGTHQNRLFFPNTTVVFVHASAEEVAVFGERVPGAVSEIRPSRGTIQPFLDRDGAITQADWVEELAGRVIRAPDGVPVVCTLDTGVAAAHPLLAPGLKGAWAVDAAWGTDDHEPDGGHGTAIAGLVLYGDLEHHAGGTNPVRLRHGVESMKLLPPHGFPPTEPPSYGFVTQSAVALTEANGARVPRSFCLATSSTDFPPSRPSSWSGAIDQIAAGSMAGEVIDNLPAAESPKRLVLVATGNVSGGMLADVLQSRPIEDPSQSWNALTIGGFTQKDVVPAPPPALSVVVPANNRSPYSLGTCELPPDLTPIKPEVLFEAGNMLVDGGQWCAHNPSVSLLALGADVVGEPLVPFWATSAAVGMAGNFFGQLHAAHRELWPETLRALAVDSANWPLPMRKRLVGRGAHWKTGTKGVKQKIIREFGYGVPDLERAMLSARNDLTMIAEAEIQPFAIGAGRTGVFNEIHFYDLPWPRAVLEQLENQVVVMKVTLSYFIEPNLTGKAAARPETYRSFGLRFAMKKRNETDAAFRARINAAQTGERPDPAAEASHWLLGSKAMQAGSLHCDLWRGHAIDLAAHDLIAIYPVGGWWKSHTGQDRVEDRGRYSLIISISAAGQAVDLYSEVANLVALHAAPVEVR
jgi:hypothetical protein